MRYPFSVSAVCIDAGFDYLTATSNTPRSNTIFESLGTRLLQEEHRLGSDVAAWQLAGYHGLTAGSIQLGTNGYSRLVRLSGHLAQQHWQRIAEEASNVSRCDWQVTMRLSRPRPTIAESCERQARRFEATHAHGRQVELRRNSVKGKTLYLGSRTSDRMTRIYDKGMQSKLEPAGTVWRAEVQYQKKLAWWRVSQILPSENVESDIASHVVHELVRVGIVWWPIGASSSLKASSAPIRRDLDMRLAWLAQQVKPTVELLRTTGFEKEMLEALGLSDYTRLHPGGIDGDLQHE